MELDEEPVAPHALPTNEPAPFLAQFGDQLEPELHALLARLGHVVPAEARVRAASEALVLAAASPHASRFTIETEQRKLYAALDALKAAVEALAATARTTQAQLDTFVVNAVFAMSKGLQTTPFTTRAHLEPLVVALNVDNPALPTNPSALPAAEMRRHVTLF